MKFKKGDIVKCIDDRHYGYNYISILSKQKHYDIISIVDNKIQIIHGYFNVKRFKKVK
jgi:predicted RNA-binding protein associated with RNAse of E/G family